MHVAIILGQRIPNSYYCNTQIVYYNTGRGRYVE